MTVSEARAAITDVIDRVIEGEEVTLTRHGKPVAVVVRPDALRARRADDALAAAERVRDVLERGRTEPLRAPPTVDAKRAEALAADVRAARTRR
jgi:antitoxin (DNA-binding transcriptional repressor) of toxin-antitoxin stability system